MASQNTALQELLLGHGQGSLNLSAVRARAEELRRSIDQIIQGLQFAADRMQWSHVLDRYAVINVQYQHLLDALRPLLRQFAAYPRSVNQSNAHVLPIMLATKLLPEMEAEEQRLLQQLEREQQLSGAAHSGPPAALSIAEQFAWVQDQEQELNHLVDQLARGDASPLGEKRRKEVQAAAARAAAAVAPATPAPGAAMQQGRAQQASPPDPLLAAVAFGAGLA